ncbi:MAG: hypothetical protein IJ364_09070 [Oscillospiraceae bacterium]|nr:hypothetical protein [Oscillospiraceae bacterium]
MLEIFLKWALPALCTALMGWLGGYLAHRVKRDKALEDGIQCLLRQEIIRSYENYFHKGRCPVYAREALTRGYAAYHSLGGNDVATDLYDKIMELPTS